MAKRQFRVLYREFLFRLVDLELLSPEGDINKLLGQFATILFLLSLLFTLPVLALADSKLPQAARLITAWPVEHSLIATTMVIVGLFAVLSWDSTFPDKRDVLVLTPLPIRVKTLFLAKVSASGSALCLTIGVFNAVPGIIFPTALGPPSTSLLDWILSPPRYRLLAAYWITLMAAGTFIFCSVLCLQGISAQLLSRRKFLRLSAFLQMAAFCLFLCVYFLQPSLAFPDRLASPANQRLLTWLPSYWFLGLFQQCNGSMHPAMVPLAQRAWIGLAVSLLGAVSAYALSYLRTLRKIVEEPDIGPSARGIHWLPRFGNSLETAIVQFSIRTLLRSRQHRVMLAFYLGAGIAIATFFVRIGVANVRELLQQSNISLIFASFLILCVWIAGTRVVFGVPLELRANWIFRVTQIRNVKMYLSAIRRPIFVLAVIPVWFGFLLLFFTLWPWRLAAGHLLLLALWATLLAYLALQGFQKVPFTCSYRPGKSFFHMAFLIAICLITVLRYVANYEPRLLTEPLLYMGVTAMLVLLIILARWRTLVLAHSEEAIVQFEDLPTPAVLTLQLTRDGMLPK